MQGQGLWAGEVGDNIALLDPGTGCHCQAFDQAGDRCRDEADLISGDHHPGGQATGANLQVFPQDLSLNAQGADLCRLQTEGLPRRQRDQGRQQ